jgi:hypothetical protein
MSIIFSAPYVIPSDVPSFSYWLAEHYLEHLQLAQIAQNLFPRSAIALFDLGEWPQRRNNPMFQLGDWDPSIGNPWLDNHQAMHQSLWEAVGSTGGQDFTQVDPDKEDSWREWEELHKVEHEQLRRLYGVF